MDRLESVDEIVEKYSVSSSPAKSRFYTGLGSLFVAFAIIGIWIPGWPTVSWAVPAALLLLNIKRGAIQVDADQRLLWLCCLRLLCNGEDHSKTREVRGRGADSDDLALILLCLGGFDQREVALCPTPPHGTEPIRDSGRPLFYWWDGLGYGTLVSGYPPGIKRISAKHAFITSWRE